MIARGWKLRVIPEAPHRCFLLWRKPPPGNLTTWRRLFLSPLQQTTPDLNSQGAPGIQTQYLYFILG